MSESKSLVERLAAMLAETGDLKIAKSGRKQHAGYDYATADDVFRALRVPLARHGVIVQTEIDAMAPVEHRGVEFMTLPVRVRFACPGEAGEWVAYAVPLATATKAGVRLDAQVLQAAITYAVKYHLRTTLLLDTGDTDADAEAPQVVDASKQPPARQRKAAPKPAAASVLRVNPDTLAIERADGKPIVPWLEAEGRTAVGSLFICAQKIIAESADGWQEIVTANRDLLMQHIPDTGRQVLAGKLAGTPLEGTLDG